LTGAHTQSIESSWSQVKKMMRNEEEFQTYVQDLWLLTRDDVQVNV